MGTACASSASPFWQHSSRKALSFKDERLMSTLSHALSIAVLSVSAAIPRSLTTFGFVVPTRPAHRSMASEQISIIVSGTSVQLRKLACTAPRRMALCSSSSFGRARDSIRTSKTSLSRFITSMKRSLSSLPLAMASKRRSRSFSKPFLSSVRPLTIIVSATPTPPARPATAPPPGAGVPAPTSLMSSVTFISAIFIVPSLG